MSAVVRSGGRRALLAERLSTRWRVSAGGGSSRAVGLMSAYVPAR